MHDRQLRCSRRKFFAQAAALTLAGGLPHSAGARDPATPGAVNTRPAHPSTEGRKPIAIVSTVYRPMAHAYHISGRFLYGYTHNGQLHLPRFYLRSLSVDQTPENDLSRELAREFDFQVTRNVADALTLGTGKLAVDGVLLVGEHGNYPRNDRQQILYPRYEMMEQIVEVFRKTGKTVPVFNDKHLSYNWARAKKMIGWAEELKFPFMAGSSLPVTWRRPELELPLGTPVEDALVAAYGPIEVYGFHALEALQVMMERRFKPEAPARDLHKPEAPARDLPQQGIKAVTCLTGKDVWKAADDGKWSWDLLEAALTRSETVNPGDVRKNVGSSAVQSMPATPAVAFLVEYRDGTRGTALLLNGHVQDFTFACKVKGETRPQSCYFYLPPPPGARFFDCLVGNIEKLLETGKPPYPAERTLLTGGALEAGMESHYRRGTRVETPDLDVRVCSPGGQRLLPRRDGGAGMIGRPQLVLARRFLVIAALMFWQGGFTFYAAVVIPIGQEVARPEQPFITRQVTHWLNLAGAVTLLILALDQVLTSGEPTWARRIRWLTWLGMVIALALLVWLHPHIDRYLDLEAQEIIDRKALRPWHRAYLWVSTVQWGLDLVYLWFTLRAWRGAEG